MKPIPGTMGIRVRRLNPSYNAVDAGCDLLYPSGYHEQTILPNDPTDGNRFNRLKLTSFRRR